MVHKTFKVDLSDSAGEADDGLGNEFGTEKMPFFSKTKSTTGASDLCHETLEVEAMTVPASNSKRTSSRPIKNTATKDEAIT